MAWSFLGYRTQICPKHLSQRRRGHGCGRESRAIIERDRVRPVDFLGPVGHWKATQQVSLGAAPLLYCRRPHRPRHTSIAPAPSCLEKTGMFSDLGERVLLRRKFWKGAACPGILLELPGQEALPGTPSGTFAAIGLCVGPLDHVTWCGIFHLDVRHPGPAICPQGSQSYPQPWMLHGLKNKMCSSGLTSSLRCP